MKSGENWFSERDVQEFINGSFYRSYDKFGAHLGEVDGQLGVWFCVWAPNADRVSVVGDFNQWSELAHPLRSLGESGVWEGFVASASAGSRYKFFIGCKANNYRGLKADPYAFLCELPPQASAVVFDFANYAWSDRSWMAKRAAANSLSAPQSIYQVHLGSWRRQLSDSDRHLTYRELALELAQYVKAVGFTHVEFLPVMEHQEESSAGLRTTGYFAPTSRFGNPEDFMFLVDTLHQHEIGVLTAWVPSSFPDDSSGLSLFDGKPLYEHPDPRLGMRSGSKAFVFNYGRPEVSNFLFSSALFWLDKYHLDGLRVEDTASMLYRDYERPAGEWVPNQYGGRENLEGIHFLRRLNEIAYAKFPEVMMVSQESSGWPMVSRPTFSGGLGFGYKWQDPWIQDLLSYISKDPIHRAYHHRSLLSGVQAAFQENYILACSERVIGAHQETMLTKMPGDVGQKFSNLRVFYGYLYGMCGKKLLFMGGEFGQWREWDYQTGLDWNLLNYPMHRGLQLWVKDLNMLLRTERALYEFDFDSPGFSWVDYQDSSQSVVSFMRRGTAPADQILCIYNFTPVARYNYRLGVNALGYWEELLNSDSRIYGGSDCGNCGGIFADEEPKHGQLYSLNLTLPPLGALFFRRLDKQ